MSIYGGIGSGDWHNPTPIRLGQTSADTPNWLLPDSLPDDPVTVRYFSYTKVAWWQFIPQEDGWVNAYHYSVYEGTDERQTSSWMWLSVYDDNYQILTSGLVAAQVPVKAGQVYNIAVASVADTHYNYDGHPDCRWVFHLVLEEMGRVIPQIHWPDKPAVVSAPIPGHLLDTMAPRLLPLSGGRCLTLWWQVDWDEQPSRFLLQGRVVHEDSTMGPEMTVREIGEPLSLGMWLNWTAQWVADLGGNRFVSLTNVYNDDISWRTMSLLRVNDDDTIDWLDGYDTDDLDGLDDSQSALAQAGPGAAVLYSYVPNSMPGEYTIHRVTASGNKLVIGPANSCPADGSSNGVYPVGLWSNGKVGVLFTEGGGSHADRVAYCFTMSGDRITMHDGGPITGWVDRGYDLTTMALPETYVADGPGPNQMISSTNNSPGFAIGLLETDGKRCWIVKDLTQNWDDDAAWLFDWGRWLPRAMNKNTGKSLWFWAAVDSDYRPLFFYDPFSRTLPYYSERMPIFEDPDYTEVWGDEDTFSPYVWERDMAADKEGSGFWAATGSEIYPGDDRSNYNALITVMHIAVTPDLDGGPIDNRRAFKAHP